MASAKELRDRIKAVQETKKITGAMHLISSTKLRRAKADFAQTRVYFDALRGSVSDILCAPPDCESRYFRAAGAEDAGVAGVLVITADKGLAGAYNSNVLRAAETLRAEIPDARLFVVGEYGRRYFAQHAPEAMVYLGGAQTPTPENAGALSDGLLARYDALELRELRVVYTDMKNSLASEVRTQRLLPLPRGAAGGGAPRAQTEFLPSEDEVLRMGVRSYLRGFVYGALLDSCCAEQNARVTAMEAANRNAQELLGGLSLQLNRQRQAAITREITEISAGAQAQRNAGRNTKLLSKDL